MGRIVGIEAVGVDRVVEPSPPHRYPYANEDPDAERTQIIEQPPAQFGHDHNEHKVVEELEPGRMALHLGGAESAGLHEAAGHAG